MIGDSRAVSAVANALSDGHRWVRDEAAAVLAALLKR
ncbi:MAG: hypothetical protein DMD91_27035 [Candidatus Rokuibacteriota bacterium]|nr:MAG: hypothetical protein DMD91_27035 [Candidatus Rokubacteria bacterium]